MYLMIVMCNTKTEPSFHHTIWKETSRDQTDALERYTINHIANVAIAFTFTSGPTYESKDAKTVWVQGVGVQG